jgi:hypothetical protein
LVESLNTNETWVHALKDIVLSKYGHWSRKVYFLEPACPIRLNFCYRTV